MNPVTPTTISRMMISTNRLISPSRTNWNVVESALGRRATIPAMMISEMPLPIPRSVTCSPIHITNIEPAVTVSTVMMRKLQPGA